MIIKATVDPNKVLTYHEAGNATDKEKQITDIKSADSYAELKTSLDTEGQIDPVIIRCEPNRVYVELGERRALALRELGITSMSVIVYSSEDAEIPFKADKVFKSWEEVDAEFSRKTYEVTRSGICPECGYDHGSSKEQVEVPSHKMMREYIDARIARF